MAISTPQPVRDPWIQEGDDVLVSPPIEKHWEQIVLFPEHQGSDYSIELVITPLKGQTLNNAIYNEAGVVLRHAGENKYYYAGIGGFGARLFIGAVDPGDRQVVWNRLASQGKKEHLAFETPYRLRVECLGTQLSLYENGERRLSVQDETYPTGCWGLRTVRTQARFGNIVVGGPARPRCFVIIPFDVPFSFVYDVIKATVEQKGFDCVRADTPAFAEPITNDIKREIMAADLVIADLTGQNANVYYEAGFAHALDKKLILIDQHPGDLAFDLVHLRTIIYQSPEHLHRELARAFHDAYWKAR